MLHSQTRKTVSIKGFLASFVFVVFIFMLSSCQKEVTGDLGTPNTTPAPPSTSNNVKTYSIDVSGTNGTHDITTFNLNYDGSNRITSFVSATAPGDKIVYKYNTDNTYTMDIFESNVLSIHEIFYLNNIPLIDSSVQYDNLAKDTTTEKYTYNSNKEWVSLKTYKYSKLTGATLLSTANHVYDNNGNIIKETEGSLVVTYQYYPDLVNNLAVGMVYFQQSKNLVKITTETEGISTPKVTTHTYTFDSNNRISSEKKVFSNGADTVIITYTY